MIPGPFEYLQRPSQKMKVFLIIEMDWEVNLNMVYGDPMQKLEKIYPGAAGGGGKFLVLFGTKVIMLCGIVGLINLSFCI